VRVGPDRSFVFIIIIIIIIMKSKAVKNADARYRDYIGLWVGPDRSVESSFVFYFIIIIIVKSKAKTLTPVIETI
jgi:hypothetical protein